MSNGRLDNRIANILTYTCQEIGRGTKTSIIASNVGKRAEYQSISPTPAQSQAIYNSESRTGHLRCFCCLGMHTCVMGTGAGRVNPKWEFEHYTAVVPSSESRKGIAAFPKQIRAAKPWLAELEQRVKANLSDQPLVLVWGTKDPVFRGILQHWETAFPQATVIRLDTASHYLQEDEPERIAEAITNAYSPNNT